MMAPNLGLKARLSLQVGALLLASLVACAWVVTATVGNMAAHAEDVLLAQREAEHRVAAAEERAEAARDVLAVTAAAAELELSTRRTLTSSAASRLARNQLLGLWLLSPGRDRRGAVPPAAATAPDEDASWLAIVDRQGQVVARGGDAATPTDTLPQGARPAVAQALQGRSFSGAAALPRLADGEPVGHLLATEPVWAPDGRLAGAVVAAVDLSRAARWLEPLVAAAGDDVTVVLSYEGGEVAIVQDDGGASAQEPSRTLSVHRAISEVALTLDVRATYALTPLVEPPGFEAGPVILRSLVALGIVAVTAAFLIPLVGGISVRRMSAIAHAAREISLGRLDAAPPGIADADEVGELARAVERLRLSVIELMRRQPRRHPWR